jgi:hypothetical protein
MTKETQYPLNPGEERDLRIIIKNLSELAAKQALYGIVQGFSLKATLTKRHFLEVMDDAKRLTENERSKGDR